MRIKTILLTIIFTCSMFFPHLSYAAEKEPTQDNGIYVIGSEEELLWFAAAVNGGKNDISAVLKNDITLSGTWTPIGKSAQKYSGTFDGKNYSISGLNDSASSGTYHGLFGYVSKTGIVKNVKVSGNLTSTESSGYVGAIAGYNEGTVSASTADMSVSGKKYIGGIVGYNSGSIENCVNLGTTESLSTYTYVGGVGGIAGYNTGAIKYSVNRGTVNNTGRYGYYTGGIVGRASGTSMNISFAYNTATVSGYTLVGGIIGGGEGSGKVQYVYSVGNVICGYTSSYAKKGGIAGSASSNMCEYAYFLQYGDINSGLNVQGSGTSKNCGGKTESELKDNSLLAMLGGAYESDSENINNGYPILKWQNPNATYKIELNVSPSDAEVVMKNSDGKIVDGVKTNGLYVFADLKNGDYTCDIFADEYETQTKNITVSASDIYVSVTLEKKKYKAVFEVIPEEAEFVLKSGEKEIEAEQHSTNIYEYRLESGVYTYFASLFGYESEEDTITIDKAPAEKKVTLNRMDCARICIKLTDRESTNEIININSKITCNDYVVTAESDGTYLLPCGEYEYVIKSSGYAKTTGKFTVDENDIKNGKTIEEYTSASVVWDGDCDEPKNIDGVWQITSGNELAWLADNVNKANTGISHNAILLNDIDLGGLQWTPIGGEVGYTQYTFNGCFDGNGKTIVGLNISSGANNLGLFGKISALAEVKNLKVCGTVKETVSGKSYIGGIVGYSIGKITDCINVADVESIGKYVGGVCGYSTGTITNSRNVGAVKANGDYSGGICGYASGKISRCENRGEISYVGGTGWYKGGICGYAQNVEISECANTGNVFANGTNAGGVVGKICSGTTITDSYNSADVSSNAYTVGGFGGATYGSASNIKIENCYSSGSVKNSTGNCGAFVGNYDGGTVINCYTFIEETDTGVNYGLSAMGKGTLIEGEILSDVDFEKLNVNEKWEKSVFYTNGKFPYLEWQSKIKITVDGKEAESFVLNGVKEIEVKNETGIANSQLFATFSQDGIQESVQCDKDRISYEYDFKDGAVLKIFFWGENMTPIENAVVFEHYSESV